MAKKTLASFLLISVTLFALGSYPLRTQAVFGVADVVIDPALIGQTIVSWLEEAARFSLTQAIKILLELAKRRILQTLQDEIVGWIQGDGDPKFVTDFGGTLKDAANNALGDTIEELGLANLCSPIQLKLQFAVQKQTPFQKQVSCTLDQIVRNFDNFRTDFRSGGWIGYQELLKPQNNVLGTKILIQQELDKRSTQEQIAIQQETQAGQGFVSIKLCDEWTLRFKDSGERVPLSPQLTNNPIHAGDTAWNGTAKPSYYPPQAPATKSEWTCTEDHLTTPGTAIASGLEKSLYSDFDYIVNAQDLTQFLAAVADAAINRLIKEGAEGLQSLNMSETTTGVPTDATIDLSTSTEQAIDLYADLSAATFDQIKNTYLRNLDLASSTLTDAAGTIRTASSTTKDLTTTIGTPTTIGTLLYCSAQHRPPLDTTWATTTLAYASSTILPTLRARSLQIPLIRTQITQAYTLLNTATSTLALGSFDQTTILAILRNVNDLAGVVTDMSQQAQDLLAEARRRLEACLNS